MKKKLVCLLLAVCLMVALAPAVLADDVILVTPQPSTTPAPAVTPVPSAAPSAAPSASPAGQNSDFIAFYLTKYTLQAGDTMSTICNTRGISFSNYQTIIKNINKISSFNYLIAGRSYWLPATSAGTAEQYYAVYKHTLYSGDTVYNLCQAYGISMSTYSDLILRINDAKSLTGFKVGKTILLPVFTEKTGTGTGTGTTPGTGTADGGNAGATTTTTVTNPDGSVTTTTPTVTTSEPANLFDVATATKYYLVPATVKTGDTLTSICNALGTSYSKNATLICQVNALTSASTIVVGTKLWIPIRSVLGWSNTDYYTVTQHEMAAGETVYGICKGAGADFAATYKLLATLNSGVNFNWLKVGQKIWIPVYAGKTTT